MCHVLYQKFCVDTGSEYQNKFAYCINAQIFPCINACSMPYNTIDFPV